MALSVAVTGASGFIGGHLCEELLRAGHRVRPVVRAGGEIIPAEAVVIDTLDGRTDWSQALLGMDVVIHAAARVHVLHETISNPVEAFREVNILATENLARQAASMGVKRLIFISSIGVLGNYNTKPFTENDVPKASNSYSQSKWRAEQSLMKVADETGLEVTIIRPPLVYGVGVKANFLRLMEGVYAGKWLPFAMVRNRRDFVSIGNLCHFIELAMRHEKAIGQTYLISDGKAISTPGMIRALARAMGKKANMIAVPDWMLYLGAKLLGKERFYHSVCSSLRIDTRKAHEELGWQPREKFEEALQQTVQWFLASRQNS